MDMKKILIALGCFALGAVIVTSCDSKSKLAADIQGAWTGNPEKVLDTGAAAATMVRVLEFSPGETSTEGTVTMTAMITVDNTMQFNDSLVTPLTITASGNASITGVYQIKDHDDILISLDHTSMQVNVDPDAVTLNYNVMTGDSAPMVEKLKPGATILATQQINQAANGIFANITEIEDVKVKNSIMTCEIGKRNLAFSRSEYSR